ncbi:hypothetical protein [Streptomyces sp. NBC_01766]|uniref:hypothetical protein n=1 Tax=Streptomyces sp. NBC_01766 TaxID=2975936 RepID=UPI002DDACB45|nr:hypothetical protein [Streptomyces sp. NBC_01766]WSC24943.1 hypothetical protein OIE60_35355 [Streptomyces sp. NBC_01766]
MSAHLPDRLIVDLGVEGEFLTDDQPGPTPGAPGGTPTEDNGPDSGTADARGSTEPGLGSRLTTSVLGLARREAAALRTGAQVLKTERTMWLNAAAETPAHLRADLLNRRYNTWTARQRGGTERLEEKAAELVKRATGLDRQAERLVADAVGDPEHTGKQASSLRKEAVLLRTQAVGWREQASETDQLPYTGHWEPAEADLERHRRRTARRRWVSTAALGLAIGWAEIRIGGMFPVLSVAGIVAAAWAKGRFTGWRREVPEVPPLAYELGTGRPAQTGAVQGAQSAGQAGATAPAGQAAAGTGPGTRLFPGDTGKPFPIRDVTSVEAVTECVRRALRAEGVPLAGVEEAVSYPWGWEVVFRVCEGTPGVITDKLGGLETRFDVGDGDVILQPNRKRTAEALLRVVTGDLFGAMKPPPYRAPRSVDITRAGVFGMSADGSDLAFSLAELMGEVIARSGGGKSTIMRDLLDWTTAAHNAVSVFLDPSGDGPGQFTDAINLTATHPIHIEFILLSLYRLAAGRARIRRRLGMGDSWRCSAEHPAVVVFIDEFPKLTKRSKQIIAEAMLVGRKEGVWVIFAAQGATRELLGSNIAEHPALKILGACRSVDTVGALGGGAIDFGYLPHRLRVKSGAELNHVAQTYIVGAPGLSEDPMLHKWHYIPDAEGGRRAAERLAAGLVDVDQASVDAALRAPNPPNLKFADEEEEYLHYVPWPELFDLVAEPVDEGDEVLEGTGPVDLPPVLQAIRDAFETAADPGFLLTDQVLDHLATIGDEWCQWEEREPADRRREGAKKIARDLKKAGIDTLKTVRRSDLDKDNPPSGYFLEHVEAAIAAFSE